MGTVNRQRFYRFITKIEIGETDQSATWKYYAQTVMRKSTYLHKMVDTARPNRFVIYRVRSLIEKATSLQLVR